MLRQKLSVEGLTENEINKKIDADHPTGTIEDELLRCAMYVQNIRNGWAYYPQAKAVLIRAKPCSDRLSVRGTEAYSVLGIEFRTGRPSIPIPKIRPKKIKRALKRQTIKIRGRKFTIFRDLKGRIRQMFKWRARRNNKKKKNISWK